ncbi:hypothetical protein KCP76_13425 [Salmonella enterica subsp. enterica serovar Weltevreden]|nr:hypothetical protein KCP76_13425 [Salmonella enterica subsp. enterica serovar Weltevreden]
MKRHVIGCGAFPDAFFAVIAPWKSMVWYPWAINLNRTRLIVNFAIERIVVFWAKYRCGYSLRQLTLPG